MLCLFICVFSCNFYVYLSIILLSFSIRSQDLTFPNLLFFFNSLLIIFTLVPRIEGDEVWMKQGLLDPKFELLIVSHFVKMRLFETPESYLARSSFLNFWNTGIRTELVAMLIEKDEQIDCFYLLTVIIVILRIPKWPGHCVIFLHIVYIYFKYI